MGTDSRCLKASTWTQTWGEMHSLELAKRAVGLEGPGEVACTNWAQFVEAEAGYTKGEQ